MLFPGKICKSCGQRLFTGQAACLNAWLQQSALRQHAATARIHSPVPCTLCPMRELIRKPQAQVSRQLVEAAIFRLIGHPGTTSLGTIMRMVDEYAASQHTARVYVHAERVVADALVEAHRSIENGKKISVYVDISSLDKKQLRKYTENFFTALCEVCRKKIFNTSSVPAAPPSAIMVGANPTCPVCLESPICTNSPECPEGQECPGCPICRNTPVRDTSGRTTAVRDTRDTVPPVPDTGGTDTVVPDTPDTVRSASDKATLATPAGDNTAAKDRGRKDRTPTDRVQMVDASPDDTSTVRTPSPAGLATGCENGKTCTKCLRMLAWDRYSRNRSRADGYASACRECEQARKRVLGGQKRPSDGPVG